MIRTYIKVWAALLGLLALTVGAAYVPLGPFNTITAMSIAVTKAVIIALYFMHLRYSPRLTWVFAGAGFFWLLLLFTLALSDYATRRYMPSPTVWLP
jgi:cytochrome c oxidase subunit 4